MTTEEIKAQIEWLGHAYAYDRKLKQSFIHYQFDDSDTWCTIGDDYNEFPPEHKHYNGEELFSPVAIEYIRRLMEDVNPEQIKDLGAITSIIVSAYRIPVFDGETREKIEKSYDSGLLTTGPFGDFVYEAVSNNAA